MEKHWNDEHVRSQWAQFGEALHASQNLAQQAQASTLCQLNHLAKFLPTPHGVNNPSLLLALVCRMRMGWVYSLDDYVTILALLQELNSLSLAEPTGPWQRARAKQQRLSWGKKVEHELFCKAIAISQMCAIIHFLQITINKVFCLLCNDCNRQK